MNISEIADILGVSKSFLYSLKKTYPAEVPKSKLDLEEWWEFVARHRIEPVGGDRITHTGVS